MASSSSPHDEGLTAPRITAAVRTGDTTQAERAAMLRTPPHILVTTPESLYLLLTSERSRQMLRTVRTVIVDEIHAVIGTRRGAHLALSLERLQQVARAPLLRASACRRRRSRSTRSGATWSARHGDACTIVDAGHRRAMDLGVEIPGAPLDAVMAHEVWEEYHDRLARAHPGASHDPRLREHATDGRAARAPLERSARRRRGHRASRQPVERDAPRRRDAAQDRRAARARRHRVARARHRHRARRSGLSDRIAAPDRHAAPARRPFGSHHRRHCPRAASSRRRATT